MSRIMLGGLLTIAAVLCGKPTLAAEAVDRTLEAADCSERLAPPRAEDVDAPVLVLVERNPWAMVIGSDEPRFALYRNGLAIYRTRDGFRQVMLDDARAGELTKAVNPGALACLETRYSTSPAFDLPSEHLFFGRGGALSGISVDGPIDREGRAKVPAVLAQAYDHLADFDDPKAAPWTPEFVEVMIWPYDYAPEPSIVWPSKWPGMRDPKTAKRGENAYSLYVPWRDYEALRAFLKTRREKGAVEIDGKKWSVELRFPFPHEPDWLTPKG
ncbi:MAG: hypothetical protein QM608_08590 [Caulobacter sp.]